ncbi:hypothetical protein [Tellurirhabdus rosea]|uniref:hypothetical protein n=1 Tax=Tellurirhabdus rosea TaxID=2674997 RepID=UPI00224F343B|nr:hypothetical protein [Tellurirhabdus rosea]
MKNRIVKYLIYSWAFLLLLSLSSCELIGDIFEAGAWTGGLLVIGMIVLAIWLVSRLFGGRRRT